MAKKLTGMEWGCQEIMQIGQNGKIFTGIGGGWQEFLGMGWGRQGYHRDEVAMAKKFTGMGW